jgi:H2-forming N5,N10-methylenetetrahydromethanopterin dehydrogenase-like enzyme
MNKNSIKQKLASAKNKVVENKTQILATVAVVATTVAVLEQIGIRSLNKFLDEKGLSDEYYNMNEDEN